MEPLGVSAELPPEGAMPRRFIYITVLLTVAGCAFGALAVAMDTEAKKVIMPFEQLNGSSRERVAREEHGLGRELDGRKGSFAAQLMQNNIKVSIHRFGAWRDLWRRHCTYSFL